ncbi:hypothetical protein THRCLA_06399 [Thraustotheca clavata]|uniref:Ankyrin repeat n=1 Tax=Thraustotheca clavata TaxID=74557 RepID=A0A1V9ZP69_9STRA|nr:hypothetical protein THRCLA_06399 [Thraustotheca clavata]
MYQRCKEYFGLPKIEYTREDYYDEIDDGSAFSEYIRVNWYDDIDDADSSHPVQISYLLAAPMENVWIDELYEELQTPVALAQAGVVGGHIRLLKYLVAEHGIDIKDLNYINCAYRAKESLFWYMEDNNSRLLLYFDNSEVYPCIVDHAAIHNHLDMIKYLHENGNKDCTTFAMDGAAWLGHLDIIKYLDENSSEGCTELAMDLASARGHFEVVKFLYERNKAYRYPFEEAVSHGHLDNAKYLHENGEKCMDTEAMDIAAELGYFNVVKFFHEQRSDYFTECAMPLAAKNGHFEIVKILH